MACRMTGMAASLATVIRVAPSTIIAMSSQDSAGNDTRCLLKLKRVLIQGKYAYGCQLYMGPTNSIANINVKNLLINYVLFQTYIFHVIWLGMSANYLFTGFL